MKTVPLCGAKGAGRLVLVDDGDYELVMQHRWYLWENKRPGRRTNGPYAITTIWREGRKTTVMMHRLIRPDFAKVDHHNHDGLDNQRENLRDGSGPRNDFNRRKHLNCSSEYIGVYWDAKAGKWSAMIHLAGRAKWLGHFTDEEAAARVRDDAAWEARGELAKLNFPR
jgi:hypothetical protein